jgi:hypothetical protein
MDINYETLSLQSKEHIKTIVQLMKHSDDEELTFEQCIDKVGELGIYYGDTLPEDVPIEVKNIDDLVLIPKEWLTRYANALRSQMHSLIDQPLSLCQMSAVT